MPAYSINCAGRRYPNAPAITLGGCLERPPPYYFFPFTAGFTGIWADVNALFMPCRFAGIAPSTGVDVRSNFNADPPLSGVRLINVHTIKLTDVWRLRCTYQLINFGGTHRIIFERQFPNGFPKWPEYYELAFLQTTGNWIWGEPAIVNCYIGSYALCPVDLCLP